MNNQDLFNFTAQQQQRARAQALGNSQQPQQPQQSQQPQRQHQHGSQSAQGIQQQLQQQPQQRSDTIQTTGARPRTIHVAHRRSPSELTTLMLEQLNLQRQLEIVQAQQQQILQAQQQLSQDGGASGVPGISLQSLSLSAQVAAPPQQQHQQQNSTVSSTSMGFGSHQGSGSGSGSGSNSPHHRRSASDEVYQGAYSPPRNHRRAQPSASSRQQAMGHSRRHSLGLNEARRAAAEAQAQRGHSPAKIPPTTQSLAPPSFKFPPSPDAGSPQSAAAESSRNMHRRSRSMLPSIERSPQRSFQFPPRPDQQQQQQNQNQLQIPGQQQQQHQQSLSVSPSAGGGAGSLLAPPQPNFNRYHRSTASDFTPGHNRHKGSYGGSTSSMTQFQNGSRKSLFAPYLPQSSLPELIAEGRLVTGILRVNKKNRSDAYVSTDGLLDSDIFICGSKDRNRALEGDLVAVELLVVDEVWSSKREKEEKKRRKDRVSTNGGDNQVNGDVHNDASSGSASGNSDPRRNGSSGGSLSRRGSLKQRPTQKKNDDVEVEGQSLLLVEEEEISDEQKPLYAGHIVAVIDRIPGQLFSGTLGLLRPSQASKDKKDNKNRSRPKIVWFKPTDKKVPLIAIPTEQAPRDFVENHDKYSDQLFVASIKRWPITSLHPFGTLVSQLGCMDDPRVEVTSILRDNNFQGDEYSDSRPERYVSELAPFDGTGRRDLGSEYVLAFSENGKASDHAVHVKVVSNSCIELGVHIADVTHYVGRDSDLDKRARKRSHGVFLPQQSVGLFPDSVATAMSFEAGRPQLAVSVIFEIDSASFEVSDVWMGETVITPAQRVNYSAVDEMLSEQKATADSAVGGYVATLALISARLRKKRLGDPDLDARVALPLLDQLDDELVRPTLNVYDQEPAALLVSELFHAVNTAVAQRVHSGLGSKALLRRYPMPAISKFEAYVSKIRQLGVELDTTNAATFHDSLLNTRDPVKRSAAQTLLVKCMPRGRYVVTDQSDQSIGHYLFNSPSYTHFTSPMRRYADLIVARQLKTVITHQQEVYPDSSEALRVTCDYCNFKKDCARSAQEQAIHLLLCQTINDMSRETGQVLCTGVVLQVYESAFDVYLPEIGVEKRVHGDQLPLRKAEFDKASRKLELYWEPGVDSATYVPEDENGKLSYRASIKNKYRAPLKQVTEQQSKALADNQLLSPEMKARLSSLGLHPPSLNEKDDLAKACNTRIEGDDHIQEIRVMERVQVLLRAEIGMALPCLTVRTVNPFQ